MKDTHDTNPGERCPCCRQVGHLIRPELGTAHLECPAGHRWEFIGEDLAAAEVPT